VTSDYKIQVNKPIPDVFPVTYIGFINDDDESVLTSPPVFTTSASIGSPPGFYDIYTSGATAPNYNIRYPTQLPKLEITSQPVLTVTFAPESRGYGEENPKPESLTFLYSGFQAGDNEHNYTLTEHPKFERYSNRALLEDALPGDNYRIFLTPGSDEKYHVQTEDGRLTITKAPMRVTIPDVNINEGDAYPKPFKFTYNSSDFKLGEDESIIEHPPIVDVDVSTERMFEKDLILTNVNDDPRYIFEATPAKLYIRPLNYVETYGNAPFDFPVPAGLTAVSNKPNIVEVEKKKDEEDKWTATIKNSSGVQPVTITINTSPLTEFWVTVNKKDLYVWVNDTTRMQGKANPEFKINYHGFVFDDNPTVIQRPLQAVSVAKPHDYPQKFEITFDTPAASTAENYNLLLGRKPGSSVVERAYLEILPGHSLPTAFSPNGDNINDIWPWVEDPNDPDSKIDIKIFNRVGLLIYQGNTGWDGKYNNSYVLPGVYFFIANYQGAEYSGTVEVIRTK